MLSSACPLGRLRIVQAAEVGGVSSAGHGGQRAGQLANAVHVLYQYYGHPYWLQGARYLLTSFLRTMNELPARQSNAAAERAGDERLDIQADLSWRQPTG